MTGCGSLSAALCDVCGTISPANAWTYWKRNDEGDRWIPNEPGDYDPMMLCPVCKWEHRDTDDGSGVFEGTLEEMEAQRNADLAEMGESWAYALEERATELEEYGNSLPDGVSTEAFAEASNLRAAARKLRA